LGIAPIVYLNDDKLYLTYQTQYQTKFVPLIKDMYIRFKDMNSGNDIIESKFIDITIKEEESLVGGYSFLNKDPFDGNIVPSCSISIKFQSCCYDGSQYYMSHINLSVQGEITSNPYNIRIASVYSERIHILFNTNGKDINSLPSPILSLSSPVSEYNSYYPYSSVLVLCDQDVSEHLSKLFRIENENENENKINKINAIYQSTSFCLLSQNYDSYNNYEDKCGKYYDVLSLNEIESIPKNLIKNENINVVLNDDFYLEFEDLQNQNLNYSYVISGEDECFIGFDIKTPFEITYDNDYVIIPRISIDTRSIQLYFEVCGSMVSEASSRLNIKVNSLNKDQRNIEYYLYSESQNENPISYEEKRPAAVKMNALPSISSYEPMHSTNYVIINVETKTDIGSFKVGSVMQSYSNIPCIEIFENEASADAFYSEKYLVSMIRKDLESSIFIFEENVPNYMYSSFYFDFYPYWLKTLPIITKETVFNEDNEPANNGNIYSSINVLNDLNIDISNWQRTHSLFFIPMSSGSDHQEKELSPALVISDATSKASDNDKAKLNTKSVKQSKSSEKSKPTLETKSIKQSKLSEKFKLTLGTKSVKQSKSSEKFKPTLETKSIKQSKLSENSKSINKKVYNGLAQRSRNGAPTIPFDGVSGLKFTENHIGLYNDKGKSIQLVNLPFDLHLTIPQSLKISQKYNFNGFTELEFTQSNPRISLYSDANHIKEEMASFYVQSTGSFAFVDATHPELNQFTISKELSWTIIDTTPSPVEPQQPQNPQEAIGGSISPTPKGTNKTLVIVLSTIIPIVCIAIAAVVVIHYMQKKKRNTEEEPDEVVAA